MEMQLLWKYAVFFKRDQFIIVTAELLVSSLFKL